MTAFNILSIILSSTLRPESKPIPQKAAKLTDVPRKKTSTVFTTVEFDTCCGDDADSPSSWA